MAITLAKLEFQTFGARLYVTYQAAMPANNGDFRHGSAYQLCWTAYRVTQKIGDRFMAKVHNGVIIGLKNCWSFRKRYFYLDVLGKSFKFKEHSIN